jgi:serine palmitoyltransferase
MPRRITIPFTNSSFTNMAQPEKTGDRRPSQSRGNRLSQFFSPSPKPKETAQPQHTSTGSFSLPTISLSAGESHNDEVSTTLFEPPSSDEVSRQKRFDAQFGPLNNPSHRYVSKHHGEPLQAPVIDEPPYYFVLTTYISYLLLIALGHIRDFFR